MTTAKRDCEAEPRLLFGSMLAFRFVFIVSDLAELSVLFRFSPGLGKWNLPFAAPLLSACMSSLSISTAASQKPQRM